jgi:type IV pilus assembly protein PilO
MNSRTITASVVGAVLVVALWWMFVFSGIRSEASDVDKEIDTAKAETTSLEAQLAQLEDLEANGAETQARLEQLRKAVPEQADLAAFIDEVNALGAASGVEWVSVAPSTPTLASGVNSIMFSMTVDGGYFQVLDFLNRVENMSRLVVVDGITLDQGESTEGTPTLTANLTARMFSQAFSAPATAGATTAPEVAGGGGVAATPNAEN